MGGRTVDAENARYMGSCLTELSREQLIKAVQEVQMWAERMKEANQFRWRRFKELIEDMERIGELNTSVQDLLMGYLKGSVSLESLWEWACEVHGPHILLMEGYSVPAKFLEEN